MLSSAWVTIATAFRAFALLHVVCFAFGAQLLSVKESAALYAAVSLPQVAWQTSLKGGTDWLSALRHPLHRRRLFFALGGAWLGAFVVPLDWAVWWQAWPLLSCALAFIAAAIAPLIFRRSARAVR
jgi:phosphatidylinositol glycan class F